MSNITIQIKETCQQPPMYYQIEGASKYICDILEKPAQIVSSHWPFERCDVISCLAFVTLGIPAAIGLGISKLIYLVKGEKIAKADYDREVDLWLEKDFLCCLDTGLAKNFIDFCIQNRIKASECPFQLILIKPVRLYGFSRLFECDAPFFTRAHLVESKKTLVVMSVEHSDTQKELVSAMGIENRNRPPTTSEIRNAYKERGSHDNDKRLTQYCDYTFLPKGSFRSRSAIERIRADII